jgi:hypothetical protein
MGVAPAQMAVRGHFSRCGVANVPHSVRTVCLARRRRREVNLEASTPQSDRKTRASGSKKADPPEDADVDQDPPEDADVDQDPPRRGRGRPTKAKASAKKVWRGEARRGMLLGRRCPGQCPMRDGQTLAG